jgi:hypothetical protein
MSAPAAVSADPALAAVAAAVRARAGGDPVTTLGGVIRRSIDEVLDGPRTGRWDFDELEKTEKTYVGTKVEIVLRAELELEKGAVLDLAVEGHEVDVKWAKDSVWQIPVEAVGQICLCLGGLRKMSQFQVGLVRIEEEYLNPGSNRDRKRTLSATGRAAMLSLVGPTPLPPNFVAQMDASVRAEVVAEPTIQARVAKLFAGLPGTPIPREAVATVARTTGDPMRRVRADAHAGDPLEGMTILSFQYGNGLAAALGYPPLRRDEFMAVPRAEIDALPEEKRRGLSAATRRRMGFDAAA